ncbi:MAG: response regulator [Candidatus Binatus sp.]|uniref:hybrid sensor histidine kinase/response regulator n=1 Tax=Candidatus Binatus sp. TaxID=2811406 RepID=UPI00271D4EBD|nr:response regulator [Candidatus Binatus sp.]MDO8431923.1 response regulator [Candidatus Binatus sp.]
METPSGIPDTLAPDNSQAKVLLVDDRAANLLALEAILSPLGVGLVKAQSGRQALELVEKEEFALILMDVRMPEMDGLKTVERIARIRGSAARIPIIFLTAAGVEGGETRDAYTRGAVDFLQKPFDPDILRSKVSVFVDLYLKEQTIRHQAALLHKREIERFQRRNELRFRALTDAMPQCVWVARSNGAIYYCNQRGIDYAAVVTGPDMFERIVHPDEREAAMAEWREAREQRRPFELKVRLRRADGEYLWHLWRGEPDFSETDELVGWITTATDIDREQRALERAATLGRVKDEFLATVSHELRNPLNAIMGWSHLLRSGNLDEPRRAKAIETIERNARLQTALVDDMLDLSRIVRGKVALSFKSVSIGSIVEAAVSAIRPTADAKNILLEVQNEAIDDIVNADPDRLQQVIWNLLSNAIKFTPRGGRVRISVTRMRNELSIEVSDTGRGIEPEFLPFVFEPFRQGDSSTTRSQSGLGLGLAIVRQLVELHCGQVRAESDGDGRGARFIVTLPLPEIPSVTGTAASNRNVDPAEQSLEGRKVLVVDDETDSRTLLAELLELHGMQVITAGSADEAIAAMDASVPDLVLSDIGMPIKDGYTLMEKIRRRPAERGGKVLASALTGYGSEADRERAHKAGFQSVIVKPFDADEIVAHIRNLLNSHAN